MLRTDFSDALITEFLNDRIPASELPRPEWGPIGEEVYKRSYSRNIVEPDGSPSPGWTWRVPEGRTTEVWGETVRRVVLGNLDYSGTYNHREAIDLFRLIYEMKMIPAGRHLWMTGVPGAALKNCHRAGWSTDTADHFRFLAMQLFMGGGVGSNYSEVFRQRGGRIVSRNHVSIWIDPGHPDATAVREAAGDNFYHTDPRGYEKSYYPFTVEDTREGWVEAWVNLISAAHSPADKAILFDLSEVRQFGAPLKSFGGRASGPAPLAKSLVKIAEVLNGAYGDDRHISAIEAMKIDHYIADAVVAGGTRRSARMSQLNWDDPEIFDFIAHKNDPEISWTTNISVLVDDRFHSLIEQNDPHAYRILHAVADGMVANGEPGLYNLALAQIGESRDVSATNPCGEAVLEEHFDPATGKGSASGESCNLGSIDLDAIGKNPFDAERAFELMARFLYRATLAPVYDPDQEEIENRNRRLGVGLMGLQGWCAAHGVKLSELPQTKFLLSELDRYRSVSRMAADGMADELGLPRSIKVTAIAPTGSIAQLRGTTSAIQPVYARYFVRRIMYANTDPNLYEMIGKGYPVEPSVYSQDTSVVSLPVSDIILDRHPEHLIEQSDEITVDQFLAVQAAVQRTFCGGNDGQAISATANIPAEGVYATDLVEVLRKHLPNIKGATVFPAKSRPQQPITAISRLEWSILTTQGLAVQGDSNSGDCAGGACPIR